MNIFFFYFLVIVDRNKIGVKGAVALAEGLKLSTKMAKLFMSILFLLIKIYKHYYSPIILNFNFFFF